MTTVIVYNLHVRVQITYLFNIFSIFDNVTKVILSHGLTYEDYDDAIKEMEEINGLILGGNPLSVKLYKPNI